MIGAILFYLIVPVGIVPDVIRLVGYIDDVAFIIIATGTIGDKLDCYADCVGIEV